VQGSKAQEYEYISSFANAAMDKIGQIPQGRHNSFDLERKCPWKQDGCFWRTFAPDIFANFVASVAYLIGPDPK
jgi:hypothetical protein